MKTHNAHCTGARCVEDRIAAGEVSAADVLAMAKEMSPLAEALFRIHETSAVGDDWHTVHALLFRLCSLAHHSAQIAELVEDKRKRLSDRILHLADRLDPKELEATTVLVESMAAGVSR